MTKEKVRESSASSSTTTKVLHGSTGNKGVKKEPAKNYNTDPKNTLVPPPPPSKPPPAAKEEKIDQTEAEARIIQLQKLGVKAMFDEDKGILIDARTKKPFRDDRNASQKIAARHLMENFKQLDAERTRGSKKFMENWQWSQTSGTKKGDGTRMDGCQEWYGITSEEAMRINDRRLEEERQDLNIETTAALFKDMKRMRRRNKKAKQRGEAPKSVIYQVAGNNNRTVNMARQNMLEMDGDELVDCIQGGQFGQTVPKKLVALVQRTSDTLTADPSLETIQESDSEGSTATPATEEPSLCGTSAASSRQTSQTKRRMIGTKGSGKGKKGKVNDEYRTHVHEKQIRAEAHDAVVAKRGCRTVLPGSSAVTDADELPAEDENPHVGNEFITEEDAEAVFTEENR